MITLILPEYLNYFIKILSFISLSCALYTKKKAENLIFDACISQYTIDRIIFDLAICFNFNNFSTQKAASSTLQGICRQATTSFTILKNHSNLHAKNFYSHAFFWTTIILNNCKIPFLQYRNCCWFVQVIRLCRSIQRQMENAILDENNCQNDSDIYDKPFRHLYAH